MPFNAGMLSPRMAPIGVLSDIHAGIKEDNRWKKDRLPAIRAFLAAFREQGCRTLLLNGDIVDDRSFTPNLDGKPVGRMKKFMRQSKDLCDEFSDWSASGEKPVYIRGNHDSERHFPEDVLEHHLGALHHESELVYQDAASGLTATHGHIFSCRCLLQIVMQPFRSKDINTLLRSNPGFVSELEAVLSHCDTGKSIQEFFRRFGLEGLGESLATAGQRLIQYWRFSIQKKISEMLCVENPWARSAAGLALSSGSRAIVMGHTHAGALHLVSTANPQAQRSVEVLVGNSGSFQEGDPTCLYVEPEDARMTLLQWNRAHGVRVLDRKELSSPEDAFQLAAA